MTPAPDSASTSANALTTRASTSHASTREKLLDVAARHFAELGYRRTSVAAIARELSITPSAVYFHFENKEDLFVAAYDREAGRLSDVVLDPSRAAGDGFIEQLMLGLATQLPDYPLVYRVVRGLEPTLMPRLATGEIPARLRSALAVALRRGQEEGSVRTDIDREVMATALESILLALLLTTVQAQGAGRGERALAVRELIWAAIGRRPR
ncbi:hypothetical protein GCM10027169_27830 [Gordonia jinhuaensis]|uniref:HTH tetR-type domain-containing protein n=1 Tax=Gordonia jinhuaensis TaxID=1517702 RepID=A0A916TBN4_9ACTN|nr:TetR/AcrR family transcriptional regulator [Gordonia jinhuaensis]GGB37185.1 hypothetical protein GCM10011489_26300 [Gordonia jinhuaensis]